MASTSQSQSHENDDFARNDLLVFILNNAANKLPLKHSDMAEIFGTDGHKKIKLHLPDIVGTLKSVYGIKLVEVPKEYSSAKKYICFADDNIKTAVGLHEEQKRDITLLFLILSYIFMMGGNVYESQLENFLESLGINYNEEHSFFGENVKKLISDTFVKQLYLKKEKSDSELDVDVKYVLSWGFRAQKEFKKKDMLKVVANLMNRDIEFYLTQYQEACGEDSGDENDVTIIE